MSGTGNDTMNVQMSKQHVKNLAADRGPLAAGAPSHGTTGTMDNPALGIGLVLDAVVDQWRFKTGGLNGRKPGPRNLLTTSRQ